MTKRKKSKAEKIEAKQATRQRKKILAPSQKANPDRTYRIAKPAEPVGKGPGTHYHEKADLNPKLRPQTQFEAERQWISEHPLGEKA